jgi:WD40 repeat protein
MSTPTLCLPGLALVVLLTAGGTGHSQQGEKMRGPAAPSSWWGKLAELLALGRSPLDRLDAGAAPIEELAPGVPDDVVAVLGSSRGRHFWPVTCLAYSPDGKWVASGGVDGVIRLWGASTLEPLTVLEGCQHVEALAFSPDGKRLAAGGGVTGLSFSKGSAWVQLWDVEATAITPGARLDWEGAYLSALAFAPDGKALAAAMETAPGGIEVGLFRPSRDHWVQLLDVTGETPQERDKLAAGGKLRSVAFSPDGQMVAAAGDAGIELWDRSRERRWEWVKVLLVVGGALTAGLAVLGALAVVAKRVAGERWVERRRFRSALRGGALWGVAALALSVVLFFLIMMLLPSGPPSLPGLLLGPWKAVAFSPDSRLLAAGGADSRVWLWDVSGKAPREQAQLVGHMNAVGAVAFTPDGRALASAGEDGTTRLWDLGGDAPRARATLRCDGGTVPALAVNPYGRSALAFAPDGRSLVTCGRGSTTLGLWHVDCDPPREEGGALGERMSARSIVFAADGRTLLLGCDDRTVRLWDLGGPSPREKLVVRGLADTPWQLALSRDGKTLAVGHEDYTVRLWDLGGETPRERAVLPGPSDLKEGDVHDGRLKASRMMGQILALCLRFSPDGKTLLAVREGIRLWDVTGPKPRELALPRRLSHDSSFRYVSFSPDSRTLAVSRRRAVTRDQPDILLWDLSGEQPRERGMFGSGGCAATFAPDGRTLLSLKFSETGLSVRAWGPERGRPTRETALEGCSPWYNDGLAPDGRTFATLGAYRSLGVWSIATGKRLAEYHLPANPAHTCPEPFAWAPDGRHLAVNCENGVVYVLRVGDNGNSCARASYRRGLTHAARREYDEAVAAFAEAIRLRPKNAEAHYQRGLAHAARGDYARAKADLDEAIRLDPTLAPKAPQTAIGGRKDERR